MATWWIVPAPRFLRLLVALKAGISEKCTLPLLFERKHYANRNEATSSTVTNGVCCGLRETSKLVLQTSLQRQNSGDHAVRTPVNSRKGTGARSQCRRT